MQAAHVISPESLRLRGFTLVELIIVIAVAGIVAGMVAVFVLRPVQGYVDLSRRATLVDAAESALRRMARDIRIALPNSVRVTDLAPGFALELLPTLDGARYATAEITDPACENLTGFDPAAADAEFDILGTFTEIAVGAAPSSHRLVINNRGTTGNNVYEDAGSGTPPLVITPVGTSITIRLNSVAVGGCPANNKHHITLSPAHQFKSESPRDRLFVVTTPVSYLCNPATTGGTLKRYEGYAIQATQPATEAAIGVAGALVADRLSACSVDTNTTSVLDRGLVTITLTLEEQGEKIRLIHQAHLDNSR
jgi:MSHA biogenesis protein MshO